MSAKSTTDSKKNKNVSDITDTNDSDIGVSVIGTVVSDIFKKYVPRLEKEIVKGIFDTISRSSTGALANDRSNNDTIYNTQCRPSSSQSQKDKSISDDSSGYNLKDPMTSPSKKRLSDDDIQEIKDVEEEKPKPQRRRNTAANKGQPAHPPCPHIPKGSEKACSKTSSCEVNGVMYCKTHAKVRENEEKRLLQSAAKAALTAESALLRKQKAIEKIKNTNTESQRKPIADVIAKISEENKRSKTIIPVKTVLDSGESIYVDPKNLVYDKISKTIVGKLHNGVVFKKIDDADRKYIDHHRLKVDSSVIYDTEPSKRDLNVSSGSENDEDIALNDEDLALSDDDLALSDDDE